MPSETSPVFLIHDDRVESSHAVRLAITSIRKHASDAEILVCVPSAGPELREWLTDRGCIEMQMEHAVSGWDAKPTLLLQALALGYPTVLWLDSDVILTADPRPRFTDEPNVIVVSRESKRSVGQGSRRRVSAWGLVPGRDLPVTANTCVLRVSDAHIELLRDWQALLTRPEYIEMQQREWFDRTIEQFSDQDAFTALLGSEPYRDLEIRLLDLGVDVAQCFGPSGFSAGQRLRSAARGMPPFVHGQGNKPWDHRSRWPYQGGLKARLEVAYQDAHLRVSPYSILARRLGAEAGVATTMFDPIHWYERLLLRLGKRWPQLPELPLAVVDKLVAPPQAQQPQWEDEQLPVA